MIAFKKYVIYKKHLYLDVEKIFNWYKISMDQGFLIKIIEIDLNFKKIFWS